MKRRDFINHSTKATFLVSSGIGVPSGYQKTLTKRDAGKYERIVVKYISTIDALFPEKKRVPLGWPVFVVPAEGPPTVLHFPEVVSPGAVRFRISAAVDFREEKRVGLFLPSSGEIIGEMVMIFAHPFQPFWLDGWIRSGCLVRVGPFR